MKVEERTEAQGKAQDRTACQRGEVKRCSNWAEDMTQCTEESTVAFLC